jgi:DNA-cytosine methyltransferase
MNTQGAQLSLNEIGLIEPEPIHLQTPELKYALDFMKSAKRFREPTQPVGNVAELFAGVGGFRLGLAKAGWKTTFSNQWEPSTKTQHASNVYTARFGEEGHSNEDIAKVQSLPRNVDLLVGGFPCQDYSVAKTLNTAKGLEGKKGVLWWEILRLVEQQKPRFVFLENVDRLLKSPSTQRGRDFAVMLKTLGDAGYLVEWRVVNAAEYGFPQRRVRVFIVATKVGKRHKLTEPQKVIAKSGVLARALPIRELMQAPMTTYIQGNIPLRVFLHLIEAIALQEDVKYFTLNGSTLKANQGRTNNLITTAGVIGYLSHLEPISWLVGGLSRNPPGVLSLSQEDLRKYFPPIP